MDLPKRIELIEVCPRDGFQNVHDIIPFEGKVCYYQEAGRGRLPSGWRLSPSSAPKPSPRWPTPRRLWPLCGIR